MNLFYPVRDQAPNKGPQEDADQPVGKRDGEGYLISEYDDEKLAKEYRLAYKGEAAQEEICTEAKSFYESLVIFVHHLL